MTAPRKGIGGIKKGRPAEMLKCLRTIGTPGESVGGARAKGPARLEI